MQKFEQHQLIEKFEKNIDSVFRQEFVRHYKYTGVTYQTVSFGNTYLGGLRLSPLNDKTSYKSRKYFPTIGNIFIVSKFVDDGIELVAEPVRPMQLLGEP